MKGKIFNTCLSQEGLILQYLGVGAWAPSQWLGPRRSSEALWSQPLDQWPWQGPWAFSSVKKEFPRRWKVMKQSIWSKRSTVCACARWWIRSKESSWTPQPRWQLRWNYFLWSISLGLLWPVIRFAWFTVHIRYISRSSQSWTWLKHLAAAAADLPMCVLASLSKDGVLLKGVWVENIPTHNSLDFQWASLCMCGQRDLWLKEMCGLSRAQPPAFNHPAIFILEFRSAREWNLQLFYAGCGGGICLLTHTATISSNPSYTCKLFESNSDLFVRNFLEKVVEVQIIVWNMTSVEYGLFWRSGLPTCQLKDWGKVIDPPCL